jgi:anti-anti-sigma factor
VADATFGCRPQTLIVDLTDTTFLDSSAITALILARHLAQHVGAAFELIGTPATTRTIQISGLYDFLHAQRERPELPVAG